MRVGGFKSRQARSAFDAAYDAGMRTLPEPTATRDVATGFGSVRVYRFGPADGPPIVLLPGRAGTAIMWRPNLVALSARHPVYAMDLLGEPGRSVQTAPLRGARDQAAWLKAVLCELDLREVHVVGVSFGGWLACNLAIRAPSRLASVSLLDPAHTLGRFPAAMLWRATLTALPVVSHWARPAFLSWISGGVPVPVGDPVADVIDAGIRGYRIAAPWPAYFTDEQLRSIRVPVLAVVAGRSVIHRAAAAHARARALIANVQAELWPDATHAITGESADEVNARVLRFVEEVAKSAPPTAR
jgi:pimeloyl-ACP methyl ester carboxylesterase